MRRRPTRPAPVWRVTSSGGTADPVRMKLGRGRLGEAVERVTRFREMVDTERSGEPAFLGIVVPDGYGLRDRDGIDVVPLAALGP